MEPIRIDRFRSIHQYGRVTLNAELSPPPTPGWSDLCQSSFARYFEGFGEQPALVDATIVVATTIDGLAISQMALEAVVNVTNQRCSEELVQSS